MPDSSNPVVETDPRRTLATLKFQKAIAKLYEDLVRATHDAREKQSNEGIHTAASYARRTADALTARFQTVEELFEATYLHTYQQQPMSESDCAWVREQAAAVIDEQLKRVQDRIEQLCSSFVGSSPQQYSKYVASAESEAVLMKGRIDNSITIHMLEQKTVPAKHHDVSSQWDVFICHASEDKAYVETLAHKLTEAGVRVWFDRTAIDWGNDLRTTIDHGLKNCTYGIVVFSKAFLAKKKWTEYELSSLFALEEPGRTRILPIWHGISEAEMREYSPGFSLRLAKVSTTRDSYQEIVESVKNLVNKTATEGGQTPSATSQYPKREHQGPAAADAHYEMVGKAEPLVKFIVRTITDGSGDYVLETWVGTPLELSSTFRGTRIEVALKFTTADKEMQLKGYSRRGNFVGDRAFNLS